LILADYKHDLGSGYIEKISVKVHKWASTNLCKKRDDLSRWIRFRLLPWFLGQFKTVWYFFKKTKKNWRDKLS